MNVLHRNCHAKHNSLGTSSKSKDQMEKYASMAYFENRKSSELQESGFQSRTGKQGSPKQSHRLQQKKPKRV
jgi:hypothetical protein